MTDTPLRVGLISDTHNLLRPQAKQALIGVDRILHAGDVCGEPVLEELRRIAPVTVVRGNNDHGAWAGRIPLTEAVEIGGITIYLLHDIAELDLDPEAAGFQVVISGHSHRPLIQRRDGVLHVNPGSAGPRRFSLPVSLGVLEISNGIAEARLMPLLP